MDVVSFLSCQKGIIGKLLAHYRYFVDGRTRVSTTMARVRMIQDYLNANGGKLIKNDRLKVSA